MERGGNVSLTTIPSNSNGGARNWKSIRQNKERPMKLKKEPLPW